MDYSGSFYNHQAKNNNLKTNKTENEIDLYKNKIKKLQNEN